MVIGGELGYRLLRWISPGGSSSRCTGAAYRHGSKLESLLGRDVWSELAGKTVIDFGCGVGTEAIEIARRGARHVFGIDIRESLLQEAQTAARSSGVESACTFCRVCPEKADVIVSLDAFEHFADPAAVLRTMAASLAPQGCILISFGPTWYHPLGGHLFSVFPWAHLLFTESALIRWRSDFKSDGARRFHEVEGGLNQMTIRRFEKIVEESGFRFVSFETVPIRIARPFHNRFTREFLTAVVRCKLARGSQQ